MKRMYAVKDIPERFREIHSRIITHWLPMGSKCGPTSFSKVFTNVGWCKAEVDRLASKGIRATTVSFGESVAVVMMRPTDTAESISAEIGAMMMEIADKGSDIPDSECDEAGDDVLNVSGEHDSLLNEERR